MAFHEIAGNTTIKKVLLSHISTNRLSRALLFVGQDGIGKRQFALAVAQAYNCLHQPLIGCGTCSICTRIKRNEYADVHIVAQDGAFIKVEQIRQTLQKSSFEPFEGKYRVVIFDSAERMNISSANSLLKLLEEPFEHLCFILITSTPEKLLETIRSRCQTIRFMPLSNEEIELYLQENFKRPVEENRFLARISQGSPGQAALADLTEIRSIRKETIELFELLGQQKQNIRLLKAAAYLGKKERGAFEESLKFISIMLHDLLCCLTNASSELIVNVDILPKLTEISHKFTSKQLVELSSKFEEVRNNLVRNINRTIALESIFIEFVSQNS